MPSVGMGRVLLPGGAGVIGSHTAVDSLGRGHEVVLLAAVVVLHLTRRVVVR